jgi:sensor histidine kinase YesM
MGKRVYILVLSNLFLLAKMLILVFFIFLCSHATFAQVKLYSKLEKTGFLDCTEQTTLWVDSTAKMPLQTISQQKFVALKKVVIPKNFSSEYRYDYWLKFSVENPTNDTLDLLFTTGVHQSSILFQVIDSQLVVISKTQEKLLPNQRLFRADDQYLTIRFLPKKSYHFLVKINDYPKEKFILQPRLASRFWQNHHQVLAFYDEYIYLISYGFLISVLFFVALFVVLFYVLDHQKYYLYYGFYTISIALFNLWEYEHSPYFHLLFSYLPSLKFTGNSNIYVFLAHIFYFLFIFEFLKLNKTFPRIAKIFQWVISFLALILLADIVILFIIKRLDWSLWLYELFQNIFPILNIFLLVMIFRAKGRVARNIQIGSSFLMLGGLMGFLTHFFNNTPFVLLRIDPSIVFVGGTLLEVFFFSIAIGIRSYKVQKEKDSLYKAVKESELRTLRSQINPHFVFNSLNSIKSYILTHRSTEAAEYLTDFSTLMRSILQHSKEQLIPLKDELETALLYVRLEQLRFEDNFEFVYDLDPNIAIDEIQIPPMLLQPYIENAIKHGLMNKEGKKRLMLKIEQSEKIKITIEDNGIGREQASLLRKNTPKYQSMGMEINTERVNLLSQTNDLHIEIIINDIKTKNGKTEGTSVVIHIPVE